MWGQRALSFAGNLSGLPQCHVGQRRKLGVLNPSSVSCQRVVGERRRSRVKGNLPPHPKSALESVLGSGPSSAIH